MLKLKDSHTLPSKGDLRYLLNEVLKAGAAQVALDTGLPLAFGVLTTDSVEQAIDRAGAKMGNKGWEAAMSVLEMVDLAHTLRGKKGK